MWTIIIGYANGSSDKVYRSTREEAREYARFLRTYCEEGMPTTVVTTKITK